MIWPLQFQECSRPPVAVSLRKQEGRHRPASFQQHFCPWSVLCSCPRLSALVSFSPSPPCSSPMTRATWRSLPWKTSARTWTRERNRGPCLARSSQRRLVPVLGAPADPGSPAGDPRAWPAGGPVLALGVGRLRSHPNSHRTRRGCWGSCPHQSPRRLLPWREVEQRMMGSLPSVL